MPGGDREKHVPLGQVNIGLLADQVGIAAADTLDPGQGVHNLLLAVDIGVQQSQNVLEVRLLAGHERCKMCDRNSMVSYSSVLYSRPRTRWFSQNTIHHRVMHLGEIRYVHMMGDSATVSRWTLGCRRRGD